MPQDPTIAELNEQLAALQAQVNALQNDKQLLEKDKAKMQACIDHLIAQLNLSKYQCFSKKSEKSPRGTLMRQSK